MTYRDRLPSDEGGGWHENLSSDPLGDPDTLVAGSGVRRGTAVFDTV